MKMKKRFTCNTVFVLAAAVLLFSQGLYAHDYHVISNPTPTVTEGKVVYLEEVQRIDEDLGNGHFLFHPRSVAADKSNVFVYDSSQAKVYRFSPDLQLSGSFGRPGQGPGEFSGAGKFNFVQIGLGRDGNLYANDMSALKMIGFDREGKYLKTFKYGNNSYPWQPTGDKDGNILYVAMKGGEIQVKNEENKVLHRFPGEKIHYGHLFFGPGKYNRQKYATRSFAPNTVWKLTMDSKLLIFFEASSSLAIVDKKGYVKTLKLWPRGLLPDLKKRFTKLREDDDMPSSLKGRLGRIKNSSFTSMFANLIIDQDHKDIFYLQAGKDGRKQNIACFLYTFDLEGRLLKVLQVPIKPGENPFFVRICAKVNNTFYAIRGRETVALYKEKI